MDDPDSSAPIAQPELISGAIEQPGHASTSFGPQTPSLPAGATFNTSHTSGGIIANAIRDINFNYYNENTTSPSPAPLPPFNDAPIDRISSCFTGREPEFDFITSSIESLRSDKPTRFVVHGMPGIGKSQLALYFANLAFTSGVYSHVLWASASTAEKLGQGMTKILVLTDHPDRSHPEQAIQLTVARLWFEQSNGHGCRRWLLILDNVTAESIDFLRENLPRQNASGTILMTTRTRDVAESVANVAGQEHPIFELKALSKDLSIDLLLKRAAISNAVEADRASAGRLVGRIGCLPLAVEQAGAFMKRSGSKSASQLDETYSEHGLQEVSCLFCAVCPLLIDKRR